MCAVRREMTFWHVRWSTIRPFNDDVAEGVANRNFIYALKIENGTRIIYILQNPTDLLSLKCLSHTPVYYVCIPQFPSICKSSIQYWYYRNTSIMPLSPLIILAHPSTMHLPALTPFALFCLCVAAQVPQYVCPHFATQTSFFNKSSGFLPNSSPQQGQINAIFSFGDRVNPSRGGGGVTYASSLKPGWSRRGVSSL